MNATLTFLKTTLLGGLVLVLPVYVTVLLLLKALAAAATMIEPISAHLPAGAHFRHILAVLVLLAASFVAGLAVRTALGRFVRRVVERNLLERVPGYAVFRGLAEKLTAAGPGGQFGVALVVIEDALVPACLVERHADGSCTVFVPSAPTPAMGTIYILPAARVFEVDVPLVKLAGCITKWGAGCGELLAKAKGLPGG